MISLSQRQQLRRTSEQKRPLLLHKSGVFAGGTSGPPSPSQIQPTGNSRQRQPRRKILAPINSLVRCSKNCPAAPSRGIASRDLELNFAHLKRPYPSRPPLKIQSNSSVREEILHVSLLGQNNVEVTAMRIPSPPPQQGMVQSSSPRRCFGK